MEEQAGEFSHIDKENCPRMVDISVKTKTIRYALARGEVWLPESPRKAFKNGDIQTKKGPCFKRQLLRGQWPLNKSTD